MMPPTVPLTVLILAGGRSTRMGQDKLWLVLDGEPLVERAARRLQPLASEILFSTREPAAFGELIARLPVPAACVLDRHPDAGPLAGLAAGLAAAACDLVVAIAADMPFANLALVRHLAALAEGYDVVVPRVPTTPPARTGEGEPTRLEPLHAVYRRSCLPAIARALAAGRRRVGSFLPDVRVREVMPAEIAALDPEFRSFVNVNTPEEWQRAACRVST